MYSSNQFLVYFLLTQFIYLVNSESFSDMKKSLGTFQNLSARLRKNMKSGVRLKYQGPSDDVRYSPIQSVEYPGNDEEKLAKIVQLWNQYYECLEAQYASLGHHKRIPPIAMVVLENRNVHLKCDICQSPQQAGDPIDWYKLDSPYDVPKRISESENYMISQDDTLSIYRAQTELAGIYYCKSGDTTTSPYYLHVFGDEEPVGEVKPDTAKKGPYASADQPLVENLKLTTVWSDWNGCSRCGVVGRKKRFGACTVVADLDSNFTDNRLAEQLHINEDSSTVGYLGFLLLFSEGLPCRSRLLPLWIRKMDQLKRANEIMAGYCKVPCSDVIFEVKDNLGNILERANNTAGIFSTLQGPPNLMPMVSRATFYCPLHEPFVLLCPGTLFIDTPIEWFVNKTIRIVPWVVEKDSNGRIQIDARERLKFRSIEEEDARIYSCWQGGQIAGIVRLVPYDSNAIYIDHHIILIGSISILSIFLYIFIRIYLNRTRAASI